ncbi:hypothetical protein H5410_015677 [Solanum commersonii]|uniref:DUF4283 domain-containing protein n=1 Tax=Solanum commersonii TaxID=4109 RepID=A0A9J5ZU61_SOLCO|nr:hypothetical protein H5410_015677 [Solanum commersonii]
MAMMVVGQATEVAGQQFTSPTTPENTNTSVMPYANHLKPVALNPNHQNQVKPIPSILIKPVTFLHGEPYIKWTEAEVARMDVIGNLQHAVVGKFSYGWPDKEQLRKIIPAQCGIKGECQIGFSEIDMY